MDKDVFGLVDFLTEYCLKLYDGMQIVFPRFLQERTLNISVLVPKYNGCYAIHNGIVCFIYNKEAYVTALTPTAIAFLRNLGFTKKSFCVPFSTREYPKYEQAQWKTLLENAKKASVKKSIIA